MGIKTYCEEGGPGNVPYPDRIRVSTLLVILQYASSSCYLRGKLGQGSMGSLCYFLSLSMNLQ